VKAAPAPLDDVEARLLVGALFLGCTSFFFGIVQLDVDIGRDFAAADLLAQGKVLYRDVFYIFGPFAPWFHTLLFRMFAPSVTLLLLAGAVASLVILAISYELARQILEPREAATAAAVVAVSAVYGSDVMSYATPYTLAATYGLLFSLLSLYAALRAIEERGWRWWDVMAGLCSALALASKQDFGLISVAVLGTALIVRWRASGQGALAAALASVAGYLLGAGFFSGWVLSRVSWAQFASNIYPPYLAGVLVPLYRRIGGWPPYASARIPQSLLGFGANLGLILWLSCLLTVLWSVRSPDRRPSWWVLGLLALASPLAWRYHRLGHYPLLLHIAVLALALWRAVPTPTRVGLLAAAGAVFFFRILPYPRSGGYGLLFFIPSLILYLFLLCAVVPATLARWISPERLRAAVPVAIVACFVTPDFVEKVRDWAWRAQPVATERGKVRLAPEEAAKARVVLDEIRRHTRPGERILLVPYGAMYYFLTGRQPASRHLDLLYGQLPDGTEERQEIQRISQSAPKLIIEEDFAQVLQFPKPPDTFGEAYNVELGAWIRRHYRQARAIRFGERQVHFWVPQPEGVR
jgi:hypothetical protein